MTTQGPEYSLMRPTGYLERFYISQNYVDFYTKVQLTVSYRIPRLLIPTADSYGFERLIYAALAETITHHPSMCVTVDDYGSLNPKWRPLHTINLRELVNFITANGAPKAWIREEHCVGFDRVGELPPWRITVAKYPEAGDGQYVFFDLGGFFLHAIADGLSTAAFQLTFLDSLNKILEGQINVSSKTLDDAAIISVPVRPLLPTLEMKAQLRTGYVSRIKNIFKAFIYNPVDRQLWTGPVINGSSGPPEPNLHIFSLPWTTVRGLISRCREEKTTVTSVVVMLIAKKIAVSYPDYSRFSCSVPYSLRRYTGHGPRDMGCYVSSTPVLFTSEEFPPHGEIPCRSRRSDNPTIDDPLLWNGARECNLRIQKAVSTPHKHNVARLKYIQNFPKYFLEMIGQKRKYSFEVTNIGIVDGGMGEDMSSTKKACFDRAVFTGNVSKFSGPFCFSICTVKRGFMTVALGWEKGVLSDENATALGESLEDSLTELGNKVNVECS